jgi:hypothetical protein
MANGLPVTPAACLTRNLLRVVDLLPMMYAFAIVSILLRRDSRRLGDLAAGTVVAYRNEIPKGGMFGPGLPTPPRIALSTRQQLAITAFAWRVGRLTPQRAEEIAAFAAPSLPESVSEASGGTPSMSARLIGIARWLHGERPPRAQTERPA